MYKHNLYKIVQFQFVNFFLSIVYTFIDSFYIYIFIITSTLDLNIF